MNQDVRVVKHGNSMMNYLKIKIFNKGIYMNEVEKFIERTLDIVDIDRQRQVILDQQLEIEEQTKKIQNMLNTAANQDKPWIIGEMYWGD